MVAVLACAPPSQPPSADVTKAEVEEALARWHDALTKGDQAAFELTYDGSRASVRRWQKGLFDGARHLPPQAAPQLLRFDRYGDGYVRAHVAVDGAKWFGAAYPDHVVRRYLRRVDGRLVLTEPLESELGPERTEQAEMLTVKYWAIDEDVGRYLLTESKRAQTDVARFASRSFSAPVLVELRPTFETLGPGWPSNQFSLGTRFSPVAIGLDRSMTTLSEASRQGLRWELAGALRQQINPRAGARLGSDVWLLDGWSALAAGPVQQPDFFKLVCSGATPPPLSELSSKPPEPSPQVDYNIRYSYQRSMVEYLYERYGSTTYWSLLDAFVLDADSKVVFPKVLNLSPEQFHTDWIAWGKKKYC